MEMFERATRKKFRFPYKGQCSVEDLWDLKVEVLDGIFKTLNARRKDQGEESLLDTNSADHTLTAQISIVKHIVATKQMESEKRRLRGEKKAERDRLLAIIDTKENEELQGKSLEELKARVRDLD